MNSKLQPAIYLLDKVTKNTCSDKANNIVLFYYPMLFILFLSVIKNLDLSTSICFLLNLQDI